MDARFESGARQFRRLQVVGDGPARAPPEGAARKAVERRPGGVDDPVSDTDDDHRGIGRDPPARWCGIQFPDAVPFVRLQLCPGHRIDFGTIAHRVDYSPPSSKGMRAWASNLARTPGR